MGKRKSNLSGFPLERRIRNTVQQLRLKKLKSRTGLMCPVCYQPRMFVQPKGKLLVLIGCKKCGVGDILPRHPTWKGHDLYNFVCDNWRALQKQKKDPTIHVPVPEFKYKKMYDSVFEYLREKVTLGKITVEMVIDDPLEEEDDE